MFQYTTDPDIKEEYWKAVNWTAAKCTISGLTPGLKYYFRVGTVGAKGQVLYGPVMAKIVS